MVSEAEADLSAEKKEVPNLLAKNLEEDSMFPLKMMSSIRIKLSSN
jgi:hypothetical protein